MVNLHPDKLDYAFVLREPDLLLVSPHHLYDMVYVYGFISDEFRIFSLGEFMKFIQHHDLSEESLLTLCGYDYVAQYLAKRKSSPPSVWKRLTQSRFPSVRWEVGCNPNAPLYPELLRDDVAWVQVSQLKRSNFPAEWISLVWNQGSQEQRNVLLEYHRERLTPEMLKDEESMMLETC